MISFICAYNNQQILEDYLLSSLKKQSNQNFELILIDTIRDKFSSAAHALNYGANQSKGSILIFVHQDVMFENVSIVDEIEFWIKQYEFGIAGLAGAIIVDNKPITATNSYHGDDHVFAGTLQITTIQECETVDEFMFIIPRNIFNYSHFIEYYPSWHFYAVEQSIRLKSIGYKVCVLPISVWHKSKGDSLDDTYFKTAIKILKYYENSNKKIVTTMGVWELKYNNIYYKYYRYILKKYYKRINNILFNKG